jgi:hypothetical protein
MWEEALDVRCAKGLQQVDKLDNCKVLAGEDVEDVAGHGEEVLEGGLGVRKLGVVDGVS